jgi:hypothetical protein
MAEHKATIAKQDLDHLSASDHIEIAEFADEFNLSVLAVHGLIKQFGNDRATLAREARTIREQITATYETNVGDQHQDESQARRPSQRS